MPTKKTQILCPQSLSQIMPLMAVMQLVSVSPVLPRWPPLSNGASCWKQRIPVTKQRRQPMSTFTFLKNDACLPFWPLVSRSRRLDESWDIICKIIPLFRETMISLAKHADIYRRVCRDVRFVDTLLSICAILTQASR